MVCLWVGSAFRCTSVNALVRSGCDWMLLISPVQSFVPEQYSAVNVPRETLSFRSDPPVSPLSRQNVFIPEDFVLKHMCW